MEKCQESKSTMIVRGLASVQEAVTFLLAFVREVQEGEVPPKSIKSEQSEPTEKRELTLSNVLVDTPLELERLASEIGKAVDELRKVLF